MPSQTEDQRQNWQTSKARSRWAESLLRRAQNQITLESDAVAKIQTAINAAQTEVAAILVDIQANQAPEWRVRRAQQQIAALERLDGELRSKLLTIARAAAEEVKILSKGMPQQQTDKINAEVTKAVSKLTRSTNSARPEIGRSAEQGRGLVAIDARSVDIAVSFVPELIADQVGTLKKAVQAEIVRNSLALTTPAESMARLTSVATPIGAFPTAAVRAEAIVRTEFGRVSNIAAMSGIQALAANPYGLSRDQRSYMLDANGVMYKEWIAVGDHRTRPEHAALDGTIIPINESFMVGEYTAQFPKDPSLPAKHAVNCRCMVVPSFPPEIADRLGAMPDDGTFGDMLAMMQDGGMVGTASGGGGEAFSYADDIPPNGFSYDIGYDPSDAALETFFVNQNATTPALSGAPDPTAPQQPITVRSGVTPLSVIAGIQQQFGLSGNVVARSRPSSVLSFVRFASKILNTAERQALLKPVPSLATHDPRLSVDAADFQLWLAEQRGEGKRKKPLKNKKKVLIDPEEVELVELPTPLIIATEGSISKLTAEQLQKLVATDKDNRESQREYWKQLLLTDEGGFGFGANNNLKPNWGDGDLQLDRKKWKAIPKAVRASIVRGILMADAKRIGYRTAKLVSDIVSDLGDAVDSRGGMLKEKAEWQSKTVLLRNMLELINAEAARLNIGTTPSDQTITVRIATPDEGQGSGYTTLNPVSLALYGTRFEKFARYIPVQDLALRVADMHKEVVLRIQVPTDPAEVTAFYDDMEKAGVISMGQVDRAAGTLRLGVSGYDFLMNYLNPDRPLLQPSGLITNARPAELFVLPRANRTDLAGDIFNEQVWYTNDKGELVFDLSSYIGNEEARAFILKHNADTGESIIDAQRNKEIEDLVDPSGKRIFQMHDLVDPPSPQVVIPADGKIVGVENIFNFLHNKTGMYDTSLLKTHYAIGGWRLARNEPVPILVLPQAINSRESAIPFLAHLEKLLAYRVATGAEGSPSKFLPFERRAGRYKPMENIELNLLGELIENGKVSVPAGEGQDPLVTWDTPPASVADLEARLPELILIANKKRRGEQLTPEEQETYQQATGRIGRASDAITEVIEWATGYNDVDNTERSTVEVAALHKRLTSLGLDLSDDFGLWRAEKLKGTVFGEIAERIIAANPNIPRDVILRRLFGIRGLSGAGISESEYQYQRLDVFAEQNGADAVDLMQFAEERGITPEQVLGEPRVAMLRKLYEADLLKVMITRNTTSNGLRDGLGNNAVVIVPENSGIPLPMSMSRKILVPAPLGEAGVTYDQLTKRPIVMVEDKFEFYDPNAAMGSGEILIQDTSQPFRGLVEVDLSGDGGFRQFLRIAVGNQLLGLANTGLFKSASYKTDQRTASPRNSGGQLNVTKDVGAESPTLGVFKLAQAATRDARRAALRLADGVGRDALHDPIQFEDVLRAVAKAAVERGANPSDPLIAAFIALPRLQDGAEVGASAFWSDVRGYSSTGLRYRNNPDLDGNPHYAKVTGILPLAKRVRPVEAVDLSALAAELFPLPDAPPAGEPQGAWISARASAVDNRAEFVRRMYKDPSFILRAILSRAYTKDQQRELMGSLAPHEGQMLVKDDAWVDKPVDIAWYELEATLLEILADEAAKNAPAGRSDGTLFSEDAYGTVKLTPELWEATQLLDAYEWDLRGNPDAQAAYDMVLAAAKTHAEERSALISARVAPIVEALGYTRGTKEYDDLIDIYTAHALSEIRTGTVVGGDDRSSDIFIPAILAGMNSKLVRFGKRGMSDIAAEGAGMAIAARFRSLARLRNPESDYREASPLTPQKLRLVAKAMRDHLVNLQLERQSLTRKEIVAVLNENNAALLGGKIKVAEWAAKARKLIRDKRSAIEAERQRLARAARSKPAVVVSEDLYEKTLEALDKDLEAAVKAIPKNKFLDVTDAQVQAEIEQYRERLDDIMKGVEQTIMGVTTTELDAPDTAKSLGSGSINEPWKGKWKGHPFIIKSVEKMYPKPIRREYGDFKRSDLWAEPAAQIIDELGGLFIRKAQAYIRDLPYLKDANGNTLDESAALVMDWLTGYSGSHSAMTRSKSPVNADLMGLFDTLIGNLDRHGGNYLFAPVPTARQPVFDDEGYPIDPVTGQKTGERWDEFKIVPIDNGLAFPDPDVHLDGGHFVNLSPFMAQVRGEKLTPRAREVLVRLWSNRSDLYVRLTAQMGASRTRGFFYRLIWMLRSGEQMDYRTFDNAGYNPQSSNADEVIRGAFDDGQSLLDANIAPATGGGVRQDPNRVEGQIPALPLSDEP